MSQILQPKVLKLYIPGETAQRKQVFESASGEILEYDVSKKLLVPSKKNQKQIISNKYTGKKYIIDSKHYVAWQKAMEPVFQKFYAAAYEAGINLPIARCKAKVLFYFPDSKDRDLTNKFETIADELTAHGIILDDTFKVMKPVHVDGWVCRDRPRTEVYLTIISPESPEYEWDITSQKYEATQLKKRAIQAKVRRRAKSAGSDNTDI
jgi:Holliday junction resolvase RusA-like endonuclease